VTFEEIQLKAFDLTQRETRRLYASIADDYKTAMQNIDRQLRNVYLKILDDVPAEEYYNYMTKYNRLENLLEATKLEYMKAARKAGGKIEESSKLAISNLYYRQQYAVNWATDAMAFVALNPKVIEVSVYGTPVTWGKLAETYGAIEDYLPQSGTLLNELITKRRPQVLADIESTIRQGLIQGTGYKKTARGIRDIMGTSMSNAERIVRTESHRNMTAGNYAMKKAAQSEGVDARRMIVSTLDTRTRPQSAQVDGRMEDENGLFLYPNGERYKIPGNTGVPKYDINDRESVIMTVDGKPPELRRGRDPVTGETDIISYQSFDEWLDANNHKFNKSGRIVPK